MVNAQTNKQTQSCIETDSLTDRQAKAGRQRDGQMQAGRETTRRTDRQNGPIKQIVLIVT